MARTGNVTNVTVESFMEEALDCELQIMRLEKKIRLLLKNKDHQPILNRNRSFNLQSPASGKNEYLLVPDTLLD